MATKYQKHKFVVLESKFIKAFFRNGQKLCEKKMFEDRK